MKITQKVLILLAALLIFSAAPLAQSARSSKILLIPLDDRPPTYQWVVKMGEIGDAEIVAPPRELLGRFTEFGKSDRIIEWAKKQNLKSFDAAIVSIDMLAYGGLVAMREYRTDDQTAQARLAFLREMKRLAPGLKIYGASVIMRLAPTGNVTNESYRENLARWAEISVDENLRRETTELERKIPAEALANYKAARRRDLQTNLAAIKLVQDRVLEQLILGQDDAKPKGVHVADRERLIAEVKRLNLQSKIGVQPGADELSMLGLARALGDKYLYRPKIKAIYSSEAIRNRVMPYEDRPLHQTVSFQIESVGAREVATEAEADITFYVYASRFEPGRARSFAEEIAAAIKKNSADAVEYARNNPGKLFKFRPMIVADIDPKGDVQGADPNFTRELVERNVFVYTPAGYAAWNTAGNTVGTALPHGMVYSVSSKILQREMLKSGIRRNPTPVNYPATAKARRVPTAQAWFTLNRLLDDYVYHSLVRPEAAKFIRENKLNPLRLSPEGKSKVENFIRERMLLHVEKEEIVKAVLSFQNEICPDGAPVFQNFKIYLPWDRTFEAEIDFDIGCRAAT